MKPGFWPYCFLLAGWLLLTGTFAFAQDTFVIEGDTLTLDDDVWEEIVLTGGEGEGIYWMKELSRKEIPVYYRFYPKGEVEYMQFGIAKGKDFTFHGPGRFFYPDGEIQGKIFFKNGILEGVLTEYFENGQLALLANYKNEREDGIFKTFYENGQLWEDNFYKEGELEGVQRSYFSNGKPESEVEFREGEPIGLAQTWYKNGHKESEVTYEAGEPHGTETIWYPSGQLWTVREYQYGLLAEVTTLNDPDGAPLDVGTFSDGYGTLNVYDEAGKLVEQSIYRRGEEVRRIIYDEEESEEKQP